MSESRQLSEELNLKLVLLEQQLAVIDELMMHKSRVVGQETAAFYVDAMNRYGHFFNAVTRSLYSSFFVELLALLGVKPNKNHILISDRWGISSIYQLAHLNGKSDEYMRLISNYSKEIVRIDELRNHIAHASNYDELRSLNVPPYNTLVRMLNDVSSFVMVIHDDTHGIPGWNTPHLLEVENEYSDDTERLINEISRSEESDEMRKKYLKSRELHRQSQE